jgi:hypothetical protein
MLSRDEALWRELAAIGRRDGGRAHEIWESLYRSTWDWGDPRVKLVDAWWMDGADRKPLDAWYGAHRSQLRK